MTIKTAVSLPSATYQKAEQARRKTKQSRSALYTKALETYLKALEIREMEARYEAGYRAHPEDPEEIRALTKASLSVIANEPW
ncbi:MAG: hypothetical protein HYZ75_11160 [Elusimicrobia bacterium]|nr:hypothetical protein [Elusimicrobiota bacterium]